MQPDNVTVPRGKPIEVDTSDVGVDGITLPNGVCDLEILDGPTEAPYGTLIVEMANSPNDPATLTHLQPGWAHSGEYKKIVQGTTVTLIRYWT